MLDGSIRLCSLDKKVVRPTSILTGCHLHIRALLQGSKVQALQHMCGFLLSFDNRMGTGCSAQLLHRCSVLLQVLRFRRISFLFLLVVCITTIIY